MPKAPDPDQGITGGATWNEPEATALADLRHLPKGRYIDTALFCAGVGEARPAFEWVGSPESDPASTAWAAARGSPACSAAWGPRRDAAFGYIAVCSYGSPRTATAVRRLVKIGHSPGAPLAARAKFGSVSSAF